MSHIKSKILNRSYTFSCAPEDAEALSFAVDYVQELMEKIKSQGKIKEAERIAVIAAIRVAGDLLSCQSQKKAKVAPKNKSAATNTDAVDLDVIGTMQEDLDRLLS